jgi:hypothetical protein
MSLINDALKRTKEAQQQNPPPAGGPTLRPADAAPAKSGSGAQMLLFTLVAAIILGNLLLWLALKDRGHQPTAANNATPVAVAAAAPAAPAAPVAVAAVAPPAAPAEPVAPAPTNLAPAALATADAPTNAAVAGTTITNEPATEPAVVFVNPKPAPLRLQSIIYNPSRPSAMIGGKFLFLGDSIQGFRLIAIDQETVTLAGNGQTNVLRLP